MLCRITRIKKNHYITEHITVAEWLRLVVVCSVHFKVSVAFTGWAPSASWSSSHSPRWCLCMGQGGEDGRPPSSAAEDSSNFMQAQQQPYAEYWGQTNKKTATASSASGPILCCRESIQAYLRPHTIAPNHVWALTHAASASLVWNFLCVLPHSSVLQGNVTHKQSKKVMTSGINFVTSALFFSLTALKSALQNAKSKRPQTAFMPFPTHNWISCEHLTNNEMSVNWKLPILQAVTVFDRDPSLVKQGTKIRRKRKNQSFLSLLKVNLQSSWLSKLLIYYK